MKEILIVIGSDPRTSPRPAEAVRVADGLSQSEELQVSLLIDGPAAAAFSASEREWVEGQLLLKHLMALRQRRIPLYLHDHGTPGMVEHLPLESIDARQAAELRHATSVVIDF